MILNPKKNVFTFFYSKSNVSTLTLSVTAVLREQDIHSMAMVIVKRGTKIRLADEVIEIL